MLNKEWIISYLRDIKNGKVKIVLDILNDERKKIGTLKPVLDDRIEDNSKIIEFITKWREYYKENFLTQFKVTEERTKNWLKNQVIKKDNRILFMVKTIEEELAGHLGVIFFEKGDFVCELDNVVKALDCKTPGIMTYAVKTLTDWLFNFLGMEKIFLRVFSDNLKAQALYLRCGFSKVKEIGLKKEIQEDSIRYVELSEIDTQLPDKILYIMELKNKNK